jgi:serine/threonine protein kinase
MLRTRTCLTRADTPPPPPFPARAGGRRLTKRTGTPVFMAPEIFARNYGGKADIWGVGVMLYWLFCKRFPFFPNAEVVKQARLEEVAHAVSCAPISYDSGPWVGMSPEGVDFVSRCLARSEDERLDTDEALSHPWLEKYIRAEDRAQVACGGAGGGGVGRPMGGAAAA